MYEKEEMERMKRNCRELELNVEKKLSDLNNASSGREVESTKMHCRSLSNLIP